MEKIYYENYDNLKLCGILNETESKNTIVVMCHGIRGNKEEWGVFTSLSEKLLENGYSSFRFDFNGHGESEGKDLDMTITKEINDLECTIEMLKKRGYKEFILLGGSFGASIVSLLPFNKYPNVKAIILWYGCLDYDYARYGNLFTIDNMKEAENNGYYVTRSLKTGKEFKFGLELFKETYKYKPYENIIKCDLPKLFVHGDKDSAVPYTLSIEISNKCSNSTLKLIKNGEHNFLDSQDSINEAVDITVDYIKNL